MEKANEWEIRSGNTFITLLLQPGLDNLILGRISTKDKVYYLIRDPIHKILPGILH